MGKIPFTSNLKGNQIDGDGLEPFLSVSFEGCKKVEKFNIMEANLVCIKVISQAYLMWMVALLFVCKNETFGWMVHHTVEISGFFREINFIESRSSTTYKLPF